MYFLRNLFTENMHKINKINEKKHHIINKRVTFICRRHIKIAFAIEKTS